MESLTNISTLKISVGNKAVDFPKKPSLTQKCLTIALCEIYTEPKAG